MAPGPDPLSEKTRDIVKATAKAKDVGYVRISLRICELCRGLQAGAGDAAFGEAGDYSWRASEGPDDATDPAADKACIPLVVKVAPEVLAAGVGVVDWGRIRRSHIGFPAGGRAGV